MTNNDENSKKYGDAKKKKENKNSKSSGCNNKSTDLIKNNGILQLSNYSTLNKIDIKNNTCTDASASITSDNKIKDALLTQGRASEGLLAQSIAAPKDALLTQGTAAPKDALLINYGDFSKNSGITKTKKDMIKKRIFPYISFEIVKLLRLDDESMSYITIRESAHKISNIIFRNARHLEELKNIDQLVITDSTSGAGGNVLSFSKLFGTVNCVEICESRHRDLINNCFLFNCSNVITYCADYTNIYNHIKQHIVFMDPPWGGSEYIHQPMLRLSLSNIPIEILSHKILENKIAKLVALKLPLNYDFDYLEETFLKLNPNYVIKRYEIKKILLIIIKIEALTMNI